MKSILFIGNFLSKSRHTIGPIEGVMSFLKGSYFIRAASFYQNRLLRLLDMLFKSLTSHYDYIHIDVYSTTNSWNYQLLTTSIAKIRNKDILLNLHGGGLWELYLKSPAKVKVLFARAHTLISPSQFLQTMFSNQGFAVQYLPNSVDVQHFPFVGGRANTYKLLWIRAFGEIYQPELAIQTLLYVKRKYKEATLTMIGPDHGCLWKIKDLVVQLALEDSVSMLGKIPNDALYQYHHSHQVYLNTTKYESFGVAVLEAAACGIPIVSTNVGELPYMWRHQENILLVDTFDGEQMAESVIKLLDNNCYAEQMADKAYEKAQSFNKEFVKSLWLQLLG